MKLKKPMIIQGKIQQVTVQNMKDKQTGQPSILNLVVISDATKPSQFRSITPLCTFIPDDKLHATLGKGDLTDIDVTLLVKEVGMYNTFVKCKGQLFKGHLTGEQVLKLQTESTVSTAAVLATK